MIDYTLDLVSGKGNPIKTESHESGAKIKSSSKSLEGKTEKFKVSM